MEQNNKIDELTGLFGFDRFLEDMKKCRQFGCYGYLLILGIDNFKNINMKYGRSFGDQVLVLVAESLQGDGPRGKQVYRLDGDRFAVMFPGGDQTTVKDMFEKVRGDLREYCTLSGGSIGCAPNCGVDCGTIYQYAEHAMDIAKEDGKDGLIFFSHESYQERLDKISLLEEFEKASRTV